MIKYDLQFVAVQHMIGGRFPRKGENHARKFGSSEAILHAALTG
ncbi:MAG: hypothetical protein AAF655_13495 [Bacteroidota bacterium]